MILANLEASLGVGSRAILRGIRLISPKAPIDILKAFLYRTTVFWLTILRSRPRTHDRQIGLDERREGAPGRLCLSTESLCLLNLRAWRGRVTHRGKRGGSQYSTWRFPGRFQPTISSTTGFRTKADSIT
jgi:hypothetical protein